MGVDTKGSWLLMLGSHGCWCCVAIVDDVAESLVLMLWSHGC